jgi:predicted HAD superfamily Cof-like phosphohydrolase
MTNAFRDQEKFMKACGQTVGDINESQYKLYCDLIDEEYNDEFKAALAANDRVEQLDALIDILVVTIGAIHSGGFDAEGAWKEVMNTNFAKIDKETGLVRKREDGKVLKPLGWKSPELAQFIKGD